VREADEPRSRKLPELDRNSAIPFVTNFRAFIARAEAEMATAQAPPDQEERRQFFTALKNLANAAKAETDEKARKAKWRAFFIHRDAGKKRGILVDDNTDPETRERLWKQGLSKYQSLAKAKEAARNIALIPTHSGVGMVRFVVVAKSPEDGSFWCFVNRRPKDRDAEIETVEPDPGRLPKITPAPYRRGELIRQQYTVTFRDKVTNSLGDTTIRANSAEQAEKFFTSRQEAEGIFRLDVVDVQEWACDWENDSFPTDGRQHCCYRADDDPGDDEIAQDIWLTDGEEQPVWADASDEDEDEDLEDDDEDEDEDESSEQILIELIAEARKLNCHLAADRLAKTLHERLAK
jgi:hypothetical protein